MTKKKYDYDFPKLFDFESAPDPPKDYDRSLQWMHPNWNKELSNLVLTRKVRESFYDCRGYFPHFAAPELLSEHEFYKFCYYAEEHHLDGGFPDNYLPHAYRDNPNEWEEHKRQQEERIRAFQNTWLGRELDEMFGGIAASVEDKDENKEEDEDMDAKPTAVPDDTKKPAAPKVDWSQWKIVKRDPDDPPPIRNLLEFNADIRSNIASFLDPLQWWDVKQMCHDAADWPKPRPEIHFDFIYFSIHNGFDEMWHGVAHTLNDVRQAVNALVQSRRDEHREDLSIWFAFIEFDKHHAIAPLMGFEESQYCKDPSHTYIHGFGQHYFGVKHAPPQANWQGHDSFWVCGLEKGANVPKIGYGFGNFLLWCNGLEPRERMDLRDIGIRKVGCSYCGMGDDPLDRSSCFCEYEFGGEESGPDRTFGGVEGNSCVIYYSPRWFGDRHCEYILSSPGDEPKSWIIFGKTTHFWDRY